MKLTDLNGSFYSSGGEGITNSITGEPVPRRDGLGILCDCPCGKCGEIMGIPFTNPIDGGPHREKKHPTWKRTGDTLETLTLKPSIQRLGGCRWHGFLTNGEFKSV